MASCHELLKRGFGVTGPARSIRSGIGHLGSNGKGVCRNEALGEHSGQSERVGLELGLPLSD
jgi:hypothetical protein